MGLAGDALDALTEGRASSGLFWASIGFIIWILCIVVICARFAVWCLNRTNTEDVYESTSESKSPAWLRSQSITCSEALRPDEKPRRKRGALDVEYADAQGGSSSSKLHDRRTRREGRDLTDPASLYVTHSNPYAIQKQKEPQHRSLSSAALTREPQAQSPPHLSHTYPVRHGHSPRHGHGHSPHASTTDPPASYHSLNARTLGSTWERTFTSAGSPLSREKMASIKSQRSSPRSPHPFSAEQNLSLPQMLTQGSQPPPDHQGHRQGDTITRISPPGPRSGGPRSGRSGPSGPSGPRSGPSGPRSGTRSGPSGSPADMSPHAEPQTPPERGHRRRCSTKGLHLQAPLSVTTRSQPPSPDRSLAPPPAATREDARAPEPHPGTRSSSSDEASTAKGSQPREAVNPAAYNGMHLRAAGASNAFSQSQGFHLEAELMLIGAQESVLSSSTDTRTATLEPSASIRHESVQLPQNPNISQYVGLVRQRHVYPQFVDNEVSRGDTLAVWHVGVRLWKLRRRDKAQFAIMRRLHHLPTSTEGRFWKQAIDLDMSHGLAPHPALDQVRTVMGAEEILYIELASHCWLQLSVLLPAMPPPAATSERWVPLKLQEGSVVSLPHGCMYKLSMTQRGNVGLVRVRMTKK